MAMDPGIEALLHRFGLDGPPPAAAPTVEQMRAGNRQLSLAVAPDPPLAVGSVADDTLAGVPVRVYRPEGGGPGPTVLFIHGGGWIVGDLDTHDNVCRRLCRDIDAVVVSVGYRLAPEHPFPAGYDDCLAVARHVAATLSRFGAGTLALAGDSAGGNLAAAVALALRDAGTPVAAQLLAYPATDLSGRTDYPSMAENATGYLLTAAECLHDIELYTGGDAATKADPRVSPLLADHKGLAPAVIGVGEHDPLRDHGIAYADALAADGVPVRQHVYPGLIHGFLNYDSVVPAVETAVAQLYGEFRDFIHADRTAG
ncbi:alpha/beta hydrolase [Streptomyces rubellomurinus]|uniref:Alpha/beta hydrolase n=1 Tax=Streptomyces sp. Y1 TaxID=3238634 RepID=A0AB39TUD3_9ACTN